MSYCPPGTGEKKEGFMTLDNPAIVLSAVKHSEKGEYYVVRLYESTGKKQKVKVHIPICNILEEIIFSPFEIKTYLIKEGRLEETTIIEGI